MKRFRLGMVLGLTLVVLGARREAPPAGRPGDASGIQLGPILSVPSPDSVHVGWHLTAPESSHRVEFGVGTELDRSVELRVSTRDPSIEVAGLVPGRTYCYRVRSGPHASPVGTFTLPDPERPFRIVLWADNQGGVDVFREQTVPTIERLEPDLLLAAGDLVEHGERREDWADQLYGPARDLLGRVPWFPVRGNHDGESAVAHAMCPLPGNGRSYVRTWGPLRIVVLDSNVYFAEGSQERRWLEEELAGPAWGASRMRLVAWHHCPWTTRWDRPDWDGDRTMREVVVPRLEAAGADLVVCGHAHCYERGDRRRPDGGRTHYLTIGGGGGHLDRVRVADWSHVRRTATRHHVLVADVGPTGVDLAAVDTATGDVFDSARIEARATRSVPGRSRRSAGAGGG